MHTYGHEQCMEFDFRCVANRAIRSTSVHQIYHISLTVVGMSSFYMYPYLSHTFFLSVSLSHTHTHREREREIVTIVTPLCVHVLILTAKMFSVVLTIYSISLQQNTIAKPQDHQELTLKQKKTAPSTTAISCLLQ